jgi:hypothetical protein
MRTTKRVNAHNTIGSANRFSPVSEHDSSDVQRTQGSKNHRLGLRVESTSCLVKYK